MSTEPNQPHRFLFDPDTSVMVAHALQVFARCTAKLAPRPIVEEHLEAILRDIGDNEQLTENQRLSIWRLCQQLLDTLYQVS